MNYIQKAILIAGAAFCFNLTMSAQDITLKNKNITVKEAMEELKKTSGYSFVFSSKDVNTGKKISISANKASIEEVVNQILKGQTDLTYEIRDKKIIVRKAVSNAAPAQAGKVKGTITDATGMPVIGAAEKIISAAKSPAKSFFILSILQTVSATENSGRLRPGCSALFRRAFLCFHYKQPFFKKQLLTACLFFRQGRQQPKISI